MPFSRSVLQGLMFGMVAIAVAVSVPAGAQAPEAIRSFDIPSQPAAQALDEWARQAGIQIVFPYAAVQGRTTPAVVGQFTPRQALVQLIQSLGLAIASSDKATVILAPVQNAAPASTASSNASAKRLQEVVVTGTRITGAPSASPTIRLSQRQIRAAGQHDLGQVIRDLPENFSGGQNPGVAQGAGDIANQNINSGSAVNLRGLGPDATLTLLNGRRLSYDAFAQAVDISAIPLAAVDRIEVVPDGASAIYGSDAVAGVVNVILKKDFQGVTAAAKLGTATEGGGYQQEYSVTGGTRWSSGGFLATFDYGRQEPIRADQRDYTSYMPGPADLLPYQRHQNALFTLHQDIGDIGTFSVDALYNRRWAYQRFSPASPTLKFSEATVTTSYVISPTATFYLPNTWIVKLNGVFGADRSHYTAIATTDAGPGIDGAGCYCNKEKAVELDGEGPLFTLPGGDAKLAVGAGYRDNGFRNYSLTSTSAPTIGHRSSRYVFGELFLPLVGPGDDVPLVHSLSFSGAARYEDYSDLGSIVTPKLGVIYAPTADFDLKGSWGRSFKTPTLLQGNQQSIVYLWPAAQLGGTGYPADATVLMPYGGNRDLRPERAETWSITAGLHPRAIKGFHVDLTYFNVAYRDRVLQPLTSLGQALSNPVYSEFLIYAPSAAEQAALIAMAPDGLTNYSNGPYDPDNVVAIANDVYSNIARQRIHGVDLRSDYRFDVAGGNIDLSANASWLTSRQQNSAGAPVFPLAGTIFNPPHFHARAGVIWTRGGLTASTFLNWLGPVQDIQSNPPVDGGSMTTLDLALLYHVGAESAFLRDTEFSLSIRNLTDRHPPYLRPLYPNEVNYDSTNYSAIGRFISLGVSRHF